MSSSKKPINSDAAQNKKKQKKHSNNDRDSDYVPVPEPSSSAFCRVFSPSQELYILQGMIDFKKQKGSYPTSSSDMKSFLTYLQDLRVVDHHIQISQLTGKIRRLKNKFKDHHLSTATATPPPDPLLDSHLFKLFELSSKIWGQSDATPSSNNEIVQEKNNAAGNPPEIRLTKHVMHLLKHLTTVVGPHDEEHNEGPHYEEEMEDDVYVAITEFEDEFENAFPFLNIFLEGQGGKVLFKQKLDSIGADELDEIEQECEQVVRLESKAGRHTARALRKLRTKLLSD